jgi:hypothetical protein
MGAIIPNRSRDKAVRNNVAVLYGVGLQDAREELFVMMVCDGLSLGLAFRRAGFESKNHNAASNLFNLPRVQERAKAILAARRSTGVVTLPQVTDMLQRVFAGAHSEGEYSAAHNAAFSLARLYGHVTDKSVIEHIRRPSRDPDAPSETALEAWAASLPVVSPEASVGPFQGPPASLLGPEPPPSDVLTTQRPVEWLEPSLDDRSTQGPGRGDGGARTGNEAPVGPVTGTPYAGGHSPLLAKDGSPSVDEGTGTNWPPIEDLF